MLQRCGILNENSFVSAAAASPVMVFLQVRNGTNLHRTGYSEGSGWSRVEYNGEILYAVTSYVISGSAPE